MQELIDQQIGHYFVEDLIGQGGIAKVYKAYDERFKRHVAIKIINRDELDIELVKERFIQEAQIIAALEHHAIVPVYDFGEYRNRSFIVMRLMRGGSLRERLLTGPLNLGTAADILDRMGNALDRAHDSGIIHRDLKPANILFDGDDIAFLADFGMARFTQMTMTGMIIGSPHYMSPEQARGGNLDRRSDVYQLGVVLYEMLTGQIPFDGESIDSVLYQHVHENAPPMRHLVPDLPIEAEEIVTRALAKDPDGRFATAGELSKVMRRLADKFGHKSVLPTPATMPNELRELPEFNLGDTLKDSKPKFSELKTAPTGVSPVYSDAHPTPLSTNPLPNPFVAPNQVDAAGSKPAPNRGWIWPLAAVLILLFGFLAFRFGGFGAFEGELGEAVAESESSDPVRGDTPPTPTLERVEGEAVVADPTLAPEPGAVAEPTADPVPPTPTNAPAATSTPLAGADFLISSTEFIGLTGSSALAFGASPIVDGDLEFNVFVWESDASRQLTTIEVDDLAPDWSADGQTMIYHSQRRDWEIYSMDVGGGNVRNLTENEFNDVFPQYMPDGRIIFQSDRADVNNRQFDLYIMDADGQNVQRLTDGPFDDVNPVVAADGTVAYTTKIPIGTYTVEQIFVLDIETGVSTQITYEDQYGSFTPSWSPDAQQIAFWSDRGDGPKIYTINRDGSLPTVVTDISDPSYFPEWSPNGQWIVFHRAMRDENPSGQFELINRDLWMARVDGTELKRLTNTPNVQERQAAFRP